MRRIGLALVAYGLIGLVLALVVATAAWSPAERAETLAGRADSSLRAAAAAARAAADGFDGFDETLERSSTSAGSAAGLARETSGTMRALAGAMSISIFGAQPLLPLVDDFDRGAEQLELLGDDMEEIGESLQASRGDAARVQDRLDTLAVELAGLQAEAPTRTPPLRALLVIGLAWGSLPAIAGLAAGTLLLRRWRQRGQPVP
jgi:hypothetical protein